MASDQSSAGEQGAFSETGARHCDGARRKTIFKSQFKRVVGPFKAYICADAWSKAHGCGEDNAGDADVSPATKARREARAEDVKNGVMQYVVKVPIEDEGAKSVLWAIGQSAVSKSPLYSAVRAVVATESLQEIVSSVLAAPGSERLLAEISEREDLRAFTEAAASNEDLFSLLAAVAADPTLQEILRVILAAPGLAGLLIEIIRRDDLRGLAETVASNEKLLSAAEILVADGLLQDIVRSTSTAPGLTGLLLEISRRDDLRKLTEALSANVPLADAAFELGKAEGELLGSLTEVIRTVNGIATVGKAGSLVADAVSAAVQDPKATIKTAAIRRAGGMRARILNWLLRVE